MKYDLKKSAEKSPVNEMPMLAAGMDKMKDSSYLCVSVYDLPEGVKGVQVGDEITLSAKVKSINTTENGIRSMEFHLTGMEDGKKEISVKKKKDTSADEIDKGVDEAAEAEENEDEE